MAHSKNPNDVDALFARAWVRSLRCAYVAMVERAFATGFRLATKAKDDAMRALEIDPDYVDAKLIAGVYEYVVGALPWPFKLMIGFAGITGSKSTGLAMLEDAGKRGVITSAESRTVIALFLRRESRYKEAIQVVRALKGEYPHDFLFCLEEANLRKDAGEGMAAVDSYRQLVADAARLGYFASSKLELAYFGLGDALRGQRHYDEAAQAYEQAASTPAWARNSRFVRSSTPANATTSTASERWPHAITNPPSIPAPTPLAPARQESTSTLPTRETERNSGVSGARCAGAVAVARLPQIAWRLRNVAIRLDHCARTMRKARVAGVRR